MLKHVQKLLLQEKLDSAFDEASKELPFERLLIFLGNDYKNREQILEITAQEQEGLENTSPCYKLQFQIHFPFAFEETKANEVAIFLCFANRMMEFPGLEIEMLDNNIFYRYVYFSQEQIDKTILLGIITTILLILDLFTESLESLASGKKNLQTLLEEMFSQEK